MPMNPQMLMQLMALAQMRQKQGAPGVGGPLPGAPPVPPGGGGAPGMTPGPPGAGMPAMPPIPGGNAAPMGTGQALAGAGVGGVPGMPPGAGPMGGPPVKAPLPGMPGSPPGLMPASVPQQQPMAGASSAPTPPNPEPTGTPGAGFDQQRPVAGRQSVPPIPRDPLGALLMGQGPLQQYQQNVPGAGATGPGGSPGSQMGWDAVIRSMMQR
jgi:hypothetical protein